MTTMTTFMNFLADVKLATFLIGLILGVICLSLLFWTIGTGQSF